MSQAVDPGVAAGSARLHVRGNPALPPSFAALEPVLKDTNTGRKPVYLVQVSRHLFIYIRETQGEKLCGNFCPLQKKKY